MSPLLWKSNNNYHVYSYVDFVAKLKYKSWKVAFDPSTKP